jgi:hypothetical protein
LRKKGRCIVEKAATEILGGLPSKIANSGYYSEAAMQEGL